MAYEMRIRDWSSDVCSSDLCIILIYLAYLSVTGPMLWRRLKGWPDGTPTVDAEGKPLFSLGRFGIPINLLAVISGLAMVVNLAWPRSAIFDPAGELPILTWAGPICIASAIRPGLARSPQCTGHS